MPGDYSKDQGFSVFLRKLRWEEKMQVSKFDSLSRIAREDLMAVTFTSMFEYAEASDSFTFISLLSGLSPTLNT